MLAGCTGNLNQPRPARLLRRRIKKSPASVVATGPTMPKAVVMFDANTLASVWMRDLNLPDQFKPLHRVHQLFGVLWVGTVGQFSILRARD